MFYLCSSQPNYYETGLILERLGEVSKICLGPLSGFFGETFLDLRRLTIQRTIRARK